MILKTDHWQGVLDDGCADRLPDWQSVETAISRLDGAVHSLLTLDDERGSVLFIGGGPTRIVVAFSEGDEHLIARQGDELDVVVITAGGQDGDYRKRNVIPREDAKHIAKAFFHGVDVRSLGQWEKG